MSYWYDLYTRNMFGLKLVAENVCPTPLLMQQAYEDPKGVEAFEGSPAEGNSPAHWRVRDDKRDPEGTVYTRIYAVTKHPEPEYI